jgi:enamine deaminase RidA (YjgF/YER057c/UK114 family)
MLIERLMELGYKFEPAPLEVLSFHTATKVGNLIFTSGQVSRLGDLEIKGKVGADIDLATARKAAEICAYNCLRAAGAVAPIESVTRVIKMLGMVNVAPGFDQTSEVINGATDFVNKLFGDKGSHARSAVGMTLPANWAVEIEMILVIE